VEIDRGFQVRRAARKAGHAATLHAMR